MGLYHQVGAKFVQYTFGLKTDSSSLIIIMAALLILVLFYTIFGGMISVIVTDYIQYVVLSIGFIISVFFSIKYFGWSNIFESIEGLKTYDEIYNPIQTRGIGYISWQEVAGFVSAVIWPTAITRALSIKHVSLVRKQYIWSSISFLIRFIVPCFLGICAFIYFNVNGNIETNDTLSLFPKYLAAILPSGLLGLVVAGMLAAFMSTHDSYLLCWSTIITNDIIEPLAKKKLSSNKKINISRIIIVILGIYIFFWGMFYKGNDEIWTYLNITGAIYTSGAIIVILFGLYWKRASSMGAILSLLGGFSAIIGIEPIRKLIGINIESPEIIGFFSLALCMCLMIFGSLIFPDDNKELSC